MYLVWVSTAILQISLNAIRLNRTHAINGSGIRFAAILSTVLWTIVLVLYIVQIFTSHWKLNATSIRTGGLWKVTEIPYHSIVAVRPSKKRDVEIETARISPAIYPHSYVIATPSDRSAFLQALRAHIPQATFETE